ncbi:MAG: toxin-antitoxin system YwqK family antitoxin [Flavobacteriales bacterium]
MRIIVPVFFALVLAACTTKEPTKKHVNAEKLIEVKNGVYSEWYPGKKQLKFHGSIDKKGNRQGKWVFYSEQGNEQSITVYNKGLREGFSLVKYPNGAMHYRGEYRNDQMVGVWTTYNEKGKVISEKDYGFPDE